MAYLIYNIQDADASPFLTGFKSFEKTIKDIPQYIKTKQQRNNIVYDAENGEKKNRNDIISMKIPFTKYNHQYLYVDVIVNEETILLIPLNRKINAKKNGSVISVRARLLIRTKPINMSMIPPASHQPQPWTRFSTFPATTSCTTPVKINPQPKSREITA